MRKAKDLIGKQIVKQQTGEQIATVRDLILSSDARSVAALIVDSGGWFRDTRVIPWSAIANIGDVVLVTGDSPIVKASEAPSLQDELKQDVRLTGLPIMNDNGERVGTVGDLYIDDGGQVVGYQVKQGLFSGSKFLFADNIQTVGRDAVLTESGKLTSVKDAEKQLEERSHAAPAAVVDSSYAAETSREPTDTGYTAETVVEPAASTSYVAETPGEPADTGAAPETQADVATPSAFFTTGESTDDNVSDDTATSDVPGDARADESTSDERTDGTAAVYAAGFATADTSGGAETAAGGDERRATQDATSAV